MAALGEQTRTHDSVAASSSELLRSHVGVAVTPAGTRVGHGEEEAQ
jgi:hypothetical protein